MNDNSPMPFGTFKGKPLIDVPAWHLLWLHENNKLTHQTELKQYIIDNLDVLEKQKKEENQQFRKN